MSDLLFAAETIIPMRAEARDASEMVSQVLFGEMAELLEKDRQWRKIRNLEDGYEGWVDEKMFIEIDREWPENVNRWVFVKQPLILAHKKTGNVQIPLNLTAGCRLPLDRNGRVKIGELEVFLDQKFPENNDSQDLSVIGLSGIYLGAPYLWGGKSVWGIDCSGFTQVVFRLAGTQLLRDASLQAEQGEEVKFYDRKAGDLAFFDNENGKIIHVGIILDDGGIRHASGNVHDDLLTEEGIIKKTDGMRSHHLKRIKRIT